MTDPFTRSPELEAITRRWLTNYAGRKSQAAINVFSNSEALTYIGSDEGELFEGRAMRDFFAAFTEDQVFLELEAMNVRAFEAGDFGWAYCTMIVHAPEADMRVNFRNTFIFTMEDGVWRIVHVHNSNPKPNLEAMGYEARGLYELAASVLSTQLDIAQTGIASIMFTDIADSTTLAEAAGDSGWSRVVSDHLAAIASQVEGQGGTLVKSLGDGTLSSFSSAGAAMRAAKAIQVMAEAETAEPRLRLRIGIHTGDVVQTDDDLVGTAVNKAARVAASAEPGEIRVSDATRAMVGGAEGFAFDDPQRVPLKGLTGEHLIHRLTW